jgi:hypothetical protein
VAVLALAAVASAASAPVKKKPPTKTHHAAKTAKKPAAKKPAPTTTAPKTQTFDKRFDCGAALPVSYLGSVYSANSWSGSVTLTRKPYNSTYEQEGFRGVSTCSYSDGGNLMIGYGSGAPSLYQEDYATAKSGQKKCQEIAAQNPGIPRVCGPVPVAGFGSTAYESGAYIAVLEGDVFVSFEAGGKLVDGEYMHGPAVPSSMLETVAKYVFSRLPQKG